MLVHPLERFLVVGVGVSLHFPVRLNRIEALFLLFALCNIVQETFLADWLLLDLFVFF